MAQFAVIGAIGVGVALGLYLGGGDETNIYARYNQEVNNEVYQDLSSECKASCSNVISGTQVVLIDTKLTGGINFEQLCPANASCTMNQAVDVAATSALSAIAEQSAIVQNSLISIGGATTNQEININQRVKNQVSQVLRSSCQANTSNLIENTIVYAKGGSIGDGVNFLQGAEGVEGANATCSMNNTAKINLYSNLAARSDQSSTILSWTGGILLIIGAIVVFAIIGFVLISIFKAGGPKPTQTEKAPPQP